MANQSILSKKVSTLTGTLILVLILIFAVFLTTDVGRVFDLRNRAAGDQAYQVIKQIVLSLDGKRIFTRACNTLNESPIDFNGCDAWVEVTGGTPYKAGLPVNPDAVPVASIGTYVYTDASGQQIYRKMVLEKWRSEGQKLWGQTCPINAAGPVWGQCSPWNEIPSFQTWRKSFVQSRVESISAYTFKKGNTEKVKRILLGYEYDPTSRSQRSTVYTSTCSLPRFNDCEPWTKLQTEQLTKWYKETGATRFNSFGAYGYRVNGTQRAKEVLVNETGTAQWTRECTLDASDDLNVFGSCGPWTAFRFPAILTQKLQKIAFRGWEAYTFTAPTEYHVVNTNSY